jgi:hypothetical protein
MEILLDKRMKKSLCKNNIIPGRVCEKCEEKYLKEGILLMNPETGSLVVIKDEVFKNLVKDDENGRKIMEDAVKKRRCFTEEWVIQGLIEAGKRAAEEAADAH